MKKILILIILIIIILVLILGFLAWRGYQLKRGLIITTYQKEYSMGENPKIKIKNVSQKTICFSSCYPYYLERNNGTLKSYRYSSCPFSDIAEICIKPGQVKAFELLLDKMVIEKGTHRIAIPACIGCHFQENFRRDKFFYSNKFIIK